ncbi:DNA helicase [Colletotrichum truncatum]|uniref:DNA helicase n=1 Tax=Colletotrichum truncatum TaxID=5467 RepID=A0ACC3ZAJ0_COLTU
MEWAKFKANKLIKANVCFRTIDNSMSAEIGCMPEAQFWSPIALFDAELAVATGDTRQFKPTSQSLDNYNRGPNGAKWHSTFGFQRVMSFLRRMEKTCSGTSSNRILRAKSI